MTRGTARKPDAQPPPAGPVVTAQLPVVSCGACRRRLAYRPERGTASERLTGHYEREHPDLIAAAC